MIYVVDDSETLRNSSDKTKHMFCSLACVSAAGYFDDAAEEHDLEADEVWDDPKCEQCGEPLRGKRTL